MKDELRDAILVTADMAEEQGEAGVATTLRMLAYDGGCLIGRRERSDRPGLTSQLAVTIASWCQSSRSGPLTAFRIGQLRGRAVIAVTLDWGEYQAGQAFPASTRPEVAIHCLDEHAWRARMLNWTPVMGRPVAEPVAKPARKPPETADLDRKPPAG
jgi:hypothetical protein